MKNRIGDLRNHLFEVIEQLKDEDHPMDVERAHAVADIAKVLVETARVEIAFAEVIGGAPTDFFPVEESSTERLKLPKGRAEK